MEGRPSGQMAPKEQRNKEGRPSGQMASKEQGGLATTKEQC